MPVFRDDNGALLSRPHLVSFLTCAAPNLAAIIASQPGHAGSVPAVLKARAERILHVAAHRHRSLVLGAWGCGVFGNDAAIVAGAFARALGHAPWFEQVTFAVHDPRPGAPVRQTFTRILAS